MNLFFILWISGSSLLAVLLSLIFGSLSPGIALFSLAAAGLGSAYASWQEINRPKLNIQSLFFLLFLGLFSFQFTYLLYEIRFDELWLATINPNNRGDLPFHINMIRAFARGLEFWPDHLFLITERLRYPFGMNLFNAQFEILGISLSAH